MRRNRNHDTRILTGFLLRRIKERVGADVYTFVLRIQLIIPELAVAVAEFWQHLAQELHSNL